MCDVYFSLSAPSTAIYKEKGSKFLAFAFPLFSEEDFMHQLEIIKKSHPTARHFCYAYKIGLSTNIYRYNDDGEPSNSAGTPIYGQILSKNITNVGIVVVRYFGGTKLGVGGLVVAYKTAAKTALENGKIIEKMVQCFYELRFDYEKMPIVMQIVKNNTITIIQQQFELSCFLEISVRLTESVALEQALNEIAHLSVVKTKVI